MKIKLGTLLLLAGLVVAILVVIVFVSSPGIVAHSLSIEDGAGVVSSKNPILFSCDGVDRVCYSAGKGIFEYNINTKETILLTNAFPQDVIGLAFNGDSFIYLNKQGALKRLPDGQLLTLGCEAIYDTIGGYYMKVDGSEVSTGSWAPANGNYGLIKLKIT